MHVLQVIFEQKKAAVAAREVGAARPPYNLMRANPLQPWHLPLITRCHPAPPSHCHTATLPHRYFADLYCSTLLIYTALHCWQNAEEAARIAAVMQRPVRKRRRRWPHRWDLRFMHADGRDRVLVITHPHGSSLSRLPKSQRIPMASIEEVECDALQRTHLEFALVCGCRVRLRAADEEALDLWLKTLRDAAKIAKFLRPNLTAPAAAVVINDQQELTT